MKKSLIDIRLNRLKRDANYSVIYFLYSFLETSVQMEHIPWVLRSSVRSVSQAASVLQSLKALLFVDQDISVNGMLQCAGCVRLGSSVLILHVGI